MKPTASGVVSTTHAELTDFVERHAAAGHWPGGVYAAGPAAAAPRWLGSAGALALDPERAPARVDALYDLASVTKPLATTAIAARLAQQGHLDLAAPLDDVLPELRGYAGSTPSFVDLLSHRSGLPAWVPLYRLVTSPAEALGALAACPPAFRAGTDANYTCPNAIAAGVALERITGQGLRELLEREVAVPLHLATSVVTYSPVAADDLPRVAPTECGRRREAALARDPHARDDIAPGPTGMIRGTVHDGNACFLGGAAGNAGLFATAEAVFRLASAMAIEGLLFDARHVRMFGEPCARGQQIRTFGFQSGASPTAPAGTFGPRSYGHTGFTGTSVWIDPGRTVVAVLLTNRVHPRWTDVPIQAWRAEFHDVVARLVVEGAE